MPSPIVSARVILVKARDRIVVGLPLMLIECVAHLSRLGGGSCFGCAAGHGSSCGIALD